MATPAYTDNKQKTFQQSGQGVQQDVHVHRQDVSQVSQGDGFQGAAGAAGAAEGVAQGPGCPVYTRQQKQKQLNINQFLQTNRHITIDSCPICNDCTKLNPLVLFPCSHPICVNCLSRLYLSCLKFEVVPETVNNHCLLSSKVKVRESSTSGKLKCPICKHAVNLQQLSLLLITGSNRNNFIRRRCGIIAAPFLNQNIHLTSRKSKDSKDSKESKESKDSSMSTTASSSTASSSSSSTLSKSTTRIIPSRSMTSTLTTPNTTSSGYSSFSTNLPFAYLAALACDINKHIQHDDLHDVCDVSTMTKLEPLERAARLLTPTSTLTSVPTSTLASTLTHSTLHSTITITPGNSLTLSDSNNSVSPSAPSNFADLASLLDLSDLSACFYHENNHLNTYIMEDNLTPQSLLLSLSLLYPRKSGCFASDCRYNYNYQPQKEQKVQKLSKVQSTHPIVNAHSVVSAHPVVLANLNIHDELQLLQEKMLEIPCPLCKAHIKGDSCGIPAFMAYYSAGYPDIMNKIKLFPQEKDKYTLEPILTTTLAHTILLTHTFSSAINNHLKECQAEVKCEHHKLNISAFIFPLHNFTGDVIANLGRVSGENKWKIFDKYDERKWKRQRSEEKNKQKKNEQKNEQKNGQDRKTESKSLQSLQSIQSVHSVQGLQGETKTKEVKQKESKEKENPILKKQDPINHKTYSKRTGITDRTTDRVTDRSTDKCNVCPSCYCHNCKRGKFCAIHSVVLQVSKPEYDQIILSRHLAHLDLDKKRNKLLSKDRNNSKISKGVGDLEELKGPQGFENFEGLDGSVRVNDEDEMSEEEMKELRKEEEKEHQLYMILKMLLLFQEQYPCDLSSDNSLRKFDSKEYLNLFLKLFHQLSRNERIGRTMLACMNILSLLFTNHTASFPKKNDKKVVRSTQHSARHSGLTEAELSVVAQEVAQALPPSEVSDSELNQLGAQIAEDLDDVDYVDYAMDLSD